MRSKSSYIRFTQVKIRKNKYVLYHGRKSHILSFPDFHQNDEIERVDSTVIDKSKVLSSLSELDRMGMSFEGSDIIENLRTVENSNRKYNIALEEFKEFLVSKFTDYEGPLRFIDGIRFSGIDRLVDVIKDDSGMSSEFFNCEIDDEMNPNGIYDSSISTFGNPVDVSNIGPVLDFVGGQHHVYVILFEDAYSSKEAIYVGQSSDVVSRLHTHRKDCPSSIPFDKAKLKGLIDLKNVSYGNRRSKEREVYEEYVENYSEDMVFGGR